MSDRPHPTDDPRLALAATAWSELGSAETLADTSTDASSLPTADSRERYQLGARLGIGGMGEVRVAFDRDTGRTLALKTLRADMASRPAAVRRFVTEARVTAQLEHPAVVPVHDVGVLPDGRLYYTMRIVRQRSLRSVLETPGARAEWPLARLCTVFLQVCRAIAYAHSRGVVHRDLKPDNVLLGDFGEVYVADWGIAKVRGRELASDIATEDELPRFATAAGMAVGTLGYMAPEQLRGDEDVDGRADVFALGVILYELLTSTRPFDGPSPLAIVHATTEVTPIRPRSLAPSCPVVLEDLCLAMLEKDRARRVSDAGQVAGEVEAFLEGDKERARRREEAERLASEASLLVDRYHALSLEQDAQRALARAAQKDLRAWDSVDAKRPGWILEDRARELEKEEARTLARAVERFAQALGYDRENRQVRSALAELYWGQAERCEQRRDEPGQIYYEELVRDYDDGPYVAKLTAKATLRVETHVPGAEVTAHRFVERDRVLRPDVGIPLGVTPILDASLDPGRWLLVLRKPGYRDVRYPVLAQRGERVEARVNLYTDAQIGAGMVYVPGGSALCGGDPDAFASLPRQSVVVPDFAIGRFHVTFAEYLELIADSSDETTRGR